MLNRFYTGLKYLIFVLSIIIIADANNITFAAARVKDLVDIKGVQDQKLIGYSLVIGLDGTGDSRRSTMTAQAVRNMLTKMGMNVPDNNLAVRNVASVMVTASVSPFAGIGSAADVTVSSLGDASSLEGGTLLMTPLMGKDNLVYAVAQGPLSIGGFNVETMSGERYRKNYSLVGRVPNGAVIERGMEAQLIQGQNLEMMLRQPDFTTAVRIAEAINNQVGSSAANAVDPGKVNVQVTDPAQVMSLVAQIEGIEVDADQEARVVINERTGTVVVGQDVHLMPTAVAHGNLTIKISSSPYVSQPPAFSGGSTVVVPQTRTQVIEEQGASVAVMDDVANVEELASMLNSLQVSPRDIIAIFQALKTAGALQAKLVIM